MGSAPYLGGGFGHFYAYAPTKIEYAIDRFAMETKRQLDVLDRRLAESEYLAGDDYTIADMAVWPWYGGLVQGLAVRRRRVPVGAGLQERPALGRRDRRAAGGQARAHGQPRFRASRPSQLHERHDASDFDTKTQDKLAARRVAAHEHDKRPVRAWTWMPCAGVEDNVTLELFARQLLQDNGLEAHMGRERERGYQRPESSKPILVGRLEASSGRRDDVGSRIQERTFPGPSDLLGLTLSGTNAAPSQRHGGKRRAAAPSRSDTSA